MLFRRKHLGPLISLVGRLGPPTAAAARAATRLATRASAAANSASHLGGSYRPSAFDRRSKLLASREREKERA